MCKYPAFISAALFALAISVNARAQHRTILTDTFYFQRGFGTFCLLLCSDSSFFVATSDCMSSDIAKGRWKINSSKLVLITDKARDVAIRPHIESRTIPGDTAVTFEILDYFSNPVKNYALTFYDAELKAYEYFTGDNGQLTVPKNKFRSYLTVHDEAQLEFPVELTTAMRFLWPGFTRITHTLNYPEYIFRQRIRAAPFEFKGGVFTKTKSGLVSATTGMKLKKVQRMARLF